MDEQPNREHVKEWMRRDVAQEIEELKSSEIEALHAQDWYRGVLAWFAKHYADVDPEELLFPDGSSDGGFDIVSIVQSEQKTDVHIYQLSTPKLEAIAEGRIDSKKEKFGDDIREVRNTIVGIARRNKKLNATASDVLRQINRHREAARSDESGSPFPLSIEIHPLSLKAAHPDARREVEQLAGNAASEWTVGAERWIIHPILDVFDLYSRYERKRPKEESPSEIKITLAGKLTAHHPNRGPFLCFIKAIDLVESYKRFGAGLLDGNLRYSLGRTEVNQRIEGELSRPSGIKWFHEKNNGIVLTCNSCGLSGETRIKLTGPQIVNGGQTIHSISTVIEQLEEIPLDTRSADDSARLVEITENLVLAARIVVVSGGGAQKSDEIALASNTQNKLSERTMRSQSVEMRDLRRILAALPCPWFLVSKDGEWAAVKNNKALVQSKTGKAPRDFIRNKKPCKVENFDLGVAVLAFCGFVEDAKPSRVFKPRFFSSLFGSRPRADTWLTLSARRVEWRGEQFSDLYESGSLDGSVWMLAHTCWEFWKTFTYPESKQFILAYDQAGQRDSEFARKWKKGKDWDVSEEARSELLLGSDSCYWVEQVAKSSYLTLVYQTMRILTKAFGALDGPTCARILQLPQFAELVDGRSVTHIEDFRLGSLSDGPLTSIGRILHYACRLLWDSNEPRIRNMSSRQQVLLKEEWIARLSDHVDTACRKISDPTFRIANHLDGPRDGELRLTNVSDLLDQGEGGVLN